ncbi:MAG: porin family protein [Eudoraea sp.]
MIKIKQLLLATLACMVLSIGLAQETKVGMRLGVGLPNLQSVDDNVYSKDYSSVAGFDGGFFLDYGLTKGFSIKAELVYTRKGGEKNGLQAIPPTQLPAELFPITQGQVVFADFDNKAVFSYIEIPILAKYEWHLGDKWGVYANAGPYVDFIISPKQVTSGDSQIYSDEARTLFQIPVNVSPPGQPPNLVLVDFEQSIPFTATTDINNDLANMDFGAMLGVGVTYQISETSEILFDARGSYGFIPLQNDTDTYGTVHMGNFTFALGYAYTIKNRSKKDNSND